LDNVSISPEYRKLHEEIRKMKTTTTRPLFQTEMESSQSELEVQRPENVTIEMADKAKEAEAILQKAQTLTISNEEQFSNASNILTVVKIRYKEIEADRQTITKPMNDALKAVNAYFSQPKILLGQAENILKSGIVKFRTYQEMKAQAEQARINEIARQKAEKDQAILEKKAQQAEKKGEEEKAMELRQVKDTVVPVAPLVQPTVIKGAGQSFRSVWKWEVTDTSAIPRQYLTLDEKQINAIARGGIQGAMHIPGIKFREEKQLAVRVG